MIYNVHVCYTMLYNVHVCYTMLYNVHVHKSNIFYFKQIFLQINSSQVIALLVN